jgi:putative two-component system response regulator
MKSTLEDTELFEHLMNELKAFHVCASVESVESEVPEPDPLAASIWIIDDASVNVKVVQTHLQTEGYQQITGFTNPLEAIDRLLHETPDVVLLDVMMPEINGIEVLKILRSQTATKHTPVLILSASSDRDTRLEALELGATDFLKKPVDRVELIARLRNALTIKAHQDRLEQYSEQLEKAVRQRTADLVASQLEVVHCLARASEFRDDITGRHVFRVGRYAGIIGLELGMTPEQAHLLELAAQLHDVGKIAMPDAILLKEGKLEPEEYSTMKKHCALGKRVFEKMDNSQWLSFREHATLGGELLGSAQSPLIRLASRIALTHHEWWNGEGYPLGLSGDDIPLEGRITAVADVFDALSSRRPYKPAYPVSKCFDILRENRGTQFDPEVLDAFLRRRDDIIGVQIEYADIDEI